MVGYSQPADPDTTAKALGRDLAISPKTSVEVCRILKGKRVEDAKDLLREVSAGERPIPYRKYNRDIGHRRGRGFGPGRYPSKVCDAIYDVIQGARDNAEYKGLDPDNLRILHIASHRGRVVHSWRPRAHGRSSPFLRRNTNIEVILEEVEEE